MPMQARIGGGSIARTHSQPCTRRRWVVSTTLWPLQPRERPFTYCAGGWVGLGASVDGMQNLPTPGFDPRTVHLPVSRYTDCATYRKDAAAHYI